MFFVFQTFSQNHTEFQKHVKNHLNKYILQSLCSFIFSQTWPGNTQVQSIGLMCHICMFLALNTISHKEFLLIKLCFSKTSGTPQVFHSKLSIIANMKHSAPVKKLSAAVHF